MDLNDIVISVFGFLNFKDLLNCFQVSQQWNFMFKYFVRMKRIRKDLQFCWQITDHQLLLNDNAENSVIPFYHPDMIFLQEDGILISMDDVNDKYFIDFYSHFGTRVRFDLVEPNNHIMFPQQSLPHFLKEDGLVIVHMGYHDDGTDEIQYGSDIVFNVNNWSKITKTLHRTIVLPNKNGKCGICQRYCQKTKILPVGTRHTVVGYGRNRFCTPLTLLNDTRLTRFVETTRPDTLNVYENDELICLIPRPEQSSLRIKDETHVMFYHWNSNLVEVVNVLTQTKFHLISDVCFLGNELYNSGGILYCVSTNRTWGKVLIDGILIQMDKQTFQANLPVYIKDENKLLLF